MFFCSQIWKCWQRLFVVSRGLRIISTFQLILRSNKRSDTVLRKLHPPTGLRYLLTMVIFNCRRTSAPRFSPQDLKAQLDFACPQLSPVCRGTITLQTTTSIVIRWRLKAVMNTLPTWIWPIKRSKEWIIIICLVISFIVQQDAGAQYVLPHVCILNFCCHLKTITTTVRGHGSQ